MIHRVIGSWCGQSDGPLLVAVAGMHGNEGAGISACREVLGLLAGEEPRFCGRLLLLAGNLSALALGQRFADEDLNRIWQPERVERVLGDPTSGTREWREQRELLLEVQNALEGVRGQVCFLDLHTTSAPGSPFSILADTPENRRLAAALPGTMVLGLDTHLDGTFLNYVNSLGFAAVGFEGGHHDDALSVDAHELAIWETLVMLGCLAEAPSSRMTILWNRLRPELRDLPDCVEIIFRHPVTQEDNFVMEPGFRNLQHVSKGRLLAHDRRGSIRASEAGRILMPLYQSQGSDGFFLAREVASNPVR